MASTRQALEQAMPALAGSLREAGLTLSGGGVFEQPRQPQPEADAGRSDGRGGREGSPGRGETAAGSADGGLAAAAGTPLRRRGVVDLVA
jgi:flagellar hook-length control protein FliK